MAVLRRYPVKSMLGEDVPAADVSAALPRYLAKAGHDVRLFMPYYSRVDDKAGSFGSLIQEIWRMFLTAMMVAMVAEAALCLPKVVRPQGAAS